MFHWYRKAAAVFVAAMLMLLLAAFSIPHALASGASFSDALANPQQTNHQQASASSVLTLNVNPYPTPFTVYEVGSTQSHVVATGTDALGPGDPITATIDWGDNTTPTQYTFIDGNTFQVAGSHAYAQVGTYTITVTVAITIFQQSASGTGTVTVVPAYTLNVHNLRPRFGHAFSGVVATGTDPFPNDSLAGTVDWGDGTTPTGVQVVSSGQRNFQVNATHTYSQYNPADSFTITVSLTSTIVGPIIATGTATIPPLYTLNARTITAQAGQPFQGSVATIRGTISAQGLLVVIEWGDGTTSKLSLPGGTGSFKVKSSHTYGVAGTYSFIVIVKDLGTGEQANASGTANVG